jgi:putative effector of murein hydrolase
LPYESYFDGAKFIHFMLGPITVALAIPLFAYSGRLKRMAFPLVVALLAGSATAVLTATGIAWALGASPRRTGSSPPSNGCSAPAISQVSRCW